MNDLDPTAGDASAPDPVDVLETAVVNLPEDVIARAYVRRIGGSQPMNIGGPLELRRDRTVLEQLVGHINRHAREGGRFEIKIKGARNAHVASARLPLELNEGPRGVPAGVPGASSTDEDPSSRAVNPTPSTSSGDGIDGMIEQLEKFKRLKRLLRDDDDEREDDDDDDEEEDDDAEATEGDEEDDLEDPVEALVEGLAEFATGEAGKALGARLVNAVADRLEAATELAKAKAVAIAKGGLAGAAAMTDDTEQKPPAEKPPEKKEPTGEGARVRRIHFDPPAGGEGGAAA